MTGTTVDGKTHRAATNTDKIILDPDGFTTAAEIAALALGAGSPTVTARSFGADPTGAVDSTAAINNAIEALPLTGGNAYIGPGNFKVNGTLNIGDGTTTTPSTRRGVRLIGGTAPAGWGLMSAGTCRLFSGAAVDMLHLKGPLTGWSIENIDFDGLSLGLVGITETAVQWGTMPGCLIRDFTIAQQLTQSVPSGPFAFNTNHMHNRYTDLVVRIPNIAGAHGIWSKGNGSDASTNSCFSCWDDLTVLFDGPPVSPNVTIGIRLQGCDSHNFSKIHYINTLSNYGLAIMFDYSFGVGQFPSANYFERVNFNAGGTLVVNFGTPGGAASPNVIALNSNGNPTIGNPSLANLNWGVTAANP